MLFSVVIFILKLGVVGAFLERTKDVICCGSSRTPTPTHETECVCPTTPNLPLQTHEIPQQRTSRRGHSGQDAVFGKGGQNTLGGVQIIGILFSFKIQCRRIDTDIVFIL